MSNLDESQDNVTRYKLRAASEAASTAELAAKALGMPESEVAQAKIIAVGVSAAQSNATER